MYEEYEDIKSQKMRLSLDIIKIKHQIKDLKLKNINIDESNEEYKSLIDKIILLLQKQEKLDYKSFNENINNEPYLKKYFKKESLKNIPNLELFEKLSVTEKDFLTKEKYDIEKDKYNIFSIKESPQNEFVEKWERIQTTKHNMNLRDYYKDRDWNGI